MGKPEQEQLNARLRSEAALGVQAGGTGLGAGGQLRRFLAKENAPLELDGVKMGALAIGGVFGALMLATSGAGAMIAGALIGLLAGAVAGKPLSRFLSGEEKPAAFQPLARPDAPKAAEPAKAQQVTLGKTVVPVPAYDAAANPKLPGGQSLADTRRDIESIVHVAEHGSPADENNALARSNVASLEASANRREAALRDLRDRMEAQKEQTDRALVAAGSSLRLPELKNAPGRAGWLAADIAHFTPGEQAIDAYGIALMEDDLAYRKGKAFTALAPAGRAAEAKKEWNALGVMDKRALVLKHLDADLLAAKDFKTDQTQLFPENYHLATGATPHREPAAPAQTTRGAIVQGVGGVLQSAGDAVMGANIPTLSSGIAGVRDATLGNLGLTDKSLQSQYIDATHPSRNDHLTAARVLLARAAKTGGEALTKEQAEVNHKAARYHLARASDAPMRDYMQKTLPPQLDKLEALEGEMLGFSQRLSAVVAASAPPAASPDALAQARTAGVGLNTAGAQATPAGTAPAPVNAPAAVKPEAKTAGVTPGQ